MAIKKQYQEVYDLLSSNKDKRISEILPLILPLIEKKVDKTYKKDKNGNITHIFCYYHKKWEDIKKVPYGKKASSHTGLNTMCKEGVRLWSKKQRDLKKYKEQLLEDVMNGKITPQELQEKLK